MPGRTPSMTPAMREHKIHRLARQPTFHPFELLLLALQVPQLRVQAVALQQCLVAAALDDAALVHHDDLVGVHDGGQPVRDDQRRAAFARCGPARLDGALGARVEAPRWLRRRS